MTRETHPPMLEPIPTTLEQQLAYLDSLKLDLTVWRFPWEYESDRWHVKAELDDKDRGIAVKTEVKAETFAAAIAATYHKLQAIEQVGIPESVFRTALPAPDPDEVFCRPEADTPTDDEILF